MVVVMIPPNLKLPVTAVIMMMIIDDNYHDLDHDINPNFSCYH